MRQPIRIWTLLLAAAALILTVLFVRLPSHALWAAEIENSAHGPVFAILAVIMLQILRRSDGGDRHSAIKRYLRVFAVAIAIGAGIELLQVPIGGDAELKDVMNDALGAAGGIFWFAFRFDARIIFPPRGNGRALLLAPAIIALVLVELPVLKCGAAYYLRGARFPTLMDASAATGTYFVISYDGIVTDVTSLPASLRPEGITCALHVRPGSIFPWGLGVLETVPRWRGKRTFALWLANPTDDVLRLRLRILDASQVGFRQRGYYLSVTVAPHSARVETVPLAALDSATGAQHVDLDTVKGVVLYGDRHQDAREFYVLKMWLE